MFSEESHLSDEQLLLSIDGELSPRDAERAESHLLSCWSCRSRKQQLETAIGEFVQAHRNSVDAQLPCSDGPRALLTAQLGQLESNRPNSRFAELIWPALAVACSLALLAYVVVYARTERNPSRLIAVNVPNPMLTPGATVLVTQSEVCMESSAKNKTVPVALQRRVFDEYGIAQATPAAYEVDYLITPALGGADDIHNLWPQAYSATIWNAQVKDALEDHLRDLVCAGQLDLTTAQREIATNWIEAYKKYFHTDRPLTRYR